MANSSAFINDMSQRRIGSPTNVKLDGVLTACFSGHQGEGEHDQLGRHTERKPLTDEYPLCATHDPGGYHDEDDYVTNSQSPTQ